MDSLTQIVLGASVGEATCGKKIGNKALVWGAVAGTIPDLDVVLGPFQDMVQYLSYHRSFSHSILFAVLMGPLFGWIFTKIFPKSLANFKDWSLLFFFGFLTHALLDTCTTWGTQLLFPFSNYGYALYNIFVIDPFYTVPFLLLVVLAAFYKRTSQLRRRINYIALSISTAYLIASFINQKIADSAFEKALAKKGIEYESYINKATPLNIILWSVTVKSGQGYYFAYYSLFDNPDDIEFDYMPANHQLLKKYRGHPKLERLIEITKGYYTVESKNEELVINDLRFGQFNGWQKNSDGNFVFKYHIKENSNNELTFTQRNYRFMPDRDYLVAYVNRIAGNTQ